MIIKNFMSYELIPKKYYEYFDKIGSGEMGLRYINSNLIYFIDFFRDYLKLPIVINNWFSGGDKDGRTLRLMDDPTYKQYSDHSHGNAIDFNVIGLNSSDIFDIITQKIPETFLKMGGVSIEAVSLTPTWTHLGFANMDAWTPEIINNIRVVK
jgi:hypothetical protein